MQTWVYDLEQFSNCHTATFKGIDTGEIRVFVVHESRNDLIEYIHFLKNDVKGLIGFNNLNYDYPLLHYILTTPALLKSKDPANELYRKSQGIILQKYSSIWDNKVLIPQLDLYKLNHYDNKNKATSLKWVEFTLRWNNLQDLPYKHNHVVKVNELNQILKYNLNDVEATEMFYRYCKDQIDMRKELSRIYKTNLINKSDSAIGVELLTRKYEELTGLPRTRFKHWRDNTRVVHLRDVIDDLIEFETPEMQNVLNDLMVNSKNIIEHDFEHNFKFKDCYYTIAKGGLHSTLKGIHIKESDTHKIIDLDFGSFYPKIMLNLGVYPPQLGEKFLIMLQDLTDRRLRAKAEGDDGTAYSLKITINSIYGNLGNKYSYTYSPKSMYKVTLNGQLIIMMLIEQLEKRGISCFYANTDGATFSVPIEAVDTFYDICQKFEKKVNIPIEYANYKMCAIRDVNNYIIQTENKIKVKGDFEIDKFPHKNNSQLVVAKALKEYYINGTLPEDFITNHTDIFDFCKGAKMTSGNKLVARTFTGQDFKDTELTKTNRYFVSNDGVTLIKVMPPLDKELETDKVKREYNQMNIFDVYIPDEFVVRKNRETNLEVGYKCTLLNDISELDRYDINYDYYIRECYKIINSIQNEFKKVQNNTV